MSPWPIQGLSAHFEFLCVWPHIPLILGLVISHIWRGVGVIDGF